MLVIVTFFMIMEEEIVHDVFIIFTGIAVNVAINSTIEIEDVDVPLITTFNLLALVIELVIIKRG